MMTTMNDDACDDDNAWPWRGGDGDEEWRLWGWWCWWWWRWEMTMMTMMEQVVDSFQNKPIRKARKRTQTTYSHLHKLHNESWNTQCVHKVHLYKLSMNACLPNDDKHRYQRQKLQSSINVIRHALNWYNSNHTTQLKITSTATFLNSVMLNDTWWICCSFYPHVKSSMCFCLMTWWSFANVQWKAIGLAQTKTTNITWESWRWNWLHPRHNIPFTSLCLMLSFLRD